MKVLKEEWDGQLAQVVEISRELEGSGGEQVYRVAIEAAYKWGPLGETILEMVRGFEPAFLGKWEEWLCGTIKGEEK